MINRSRAKCVGKARIFEIEDDFKLAAEIFFVFFVAKMFDFRRE